MLLGLKFSEWKMDVLGGRRDTAALWSSGPERDRLYKMHNKAALFSLFGWKSAVSFAERFGTGPIGREIQPRSGAASKVMLGWSNPSDSKTMISFSPERSNGAGR